VPDLYGPFWTLTTLIFTLFVTSSLAHSIVSHLSSHAVEYDFALLSTAVGLVYVYGIGVPVMLWVALRYAGITVWGYAMFVWIPVSVRDIVSALVAPFFKSSRFRSSALFLSPFFAGFYPIGFAVSGYFLVANVYPVLVSVRHPSFLVSKAWP